MNQAVASATNPTKMATAKMGLQGLSATENVAHAQGIHDKMDANVLYPGPVPTMLVFQGHIDALAKANAEVENNGGKAEYQARNVALKAVRAAIKSLCGYVQTTSGGDAVKINLGGFEVVQRGGPIGELAPPSKLVTRNTNMSGRVSFAWPREDGADMHHVYMSASNDPFKWDLVGATTKSRFNMDSLDPGVVYWFAVTAIGAAGETSKSEPLMARAA